MLLPFADLEQCKFISQYESKKTACSQSLLATLALNSIFVFPTLLTVARHEIVVSVEMKKIKSFARPPVQVSKNRSRIIQYGSAIIYFKRSNSLDQRGGRQLISL